MDTERMQSQQRKTWTATRTSIISDKATTFEAISPILSMCYLYDIECIIAIQYDYDAEYDMMPTAINDTMIGCKSVCAIFDFQYEKWQEIKIEKRLK